MLVLHVLWKWVLRFHALSHSVHLSQLEREKKVSAVSSFKNEPVIVFAN